MIGTESGMHPLGPLLAHRSYTRGRLKRLVSGVGPIREDIRKLSPQEREKVVTFSWDWTMIFRTSGQDENELSDFGDLAESDSRANQANLPDAREGLPSGSVYQWV